MFIRDLEELHALLFSCSEPFALDSSLILSFCLSFFTAYLTTLSYMRVELIETYSNAYKYCLHKTVWMDILDNIFLIRSEVIVINLFRFFVHNFG